MKTFLLCISATLVLTTISPIWAQEPTGTPSLIPPGPLIVKIPTNTRCVITVTDLAAKSADGSASKAVVQQITKTRSGDIGCDEVNDIASKQKAQTWMTKDYIVVIDPVTKEATAAAKVSAGTAPTALPDDRPMNNATEYPGTGCVLARYFKDIATVSGRKYVAFEDSGSESSAYIDLKTRLPVSARSVDTGYSYQFSAVPEGSLVLPSEAVKAITSIKQAYERAALRP